MRAFLLRGLLVLALPVLLVSTVQEVYSQSQSDSSNERYWIFFDSKQVDADAALPTGSHVTQAARNRRDVRGVADSEWLDAGVSPAYLNQLGHYGVIPVVTSRWLNAVSARLTESQVQSVESLPFVRLVRPVAVQKVSSSGPSFPSFAPARSPTTAKGTSVIDYGASRPQLETVNAIPAIERGMDGSGVRLGFLDTEYDDLQHPVFDRLRAEGRLIAQQDFTEQSDRVTPWWWHGMSVASVAVGYLEGELVGPAYGADVLLATTEVVATETNQEEDFFVQGLEWLEANGADVVNVSLGYSVFESGQDSYTYQDMDGDTAITTVAADIAVSLGMVMVAAAGNEGSCGNPDNCWYYIASPADGNDVITVGGVNSAGGRYTAGSYGPTADGRIKPDVAAQAAGVYVALPVPLPSGFYNGTSFASPMVAGIVCQMLQANPALTPQEVASLLRESGSQSASPDNSLGWGVIDADAAVRAAEAMATSTESPISIQPSVTAFPVPMRNSVSLEISTTASFRNVHIVIYDALGRSVSSSAHTLQSAGVSRFDIDTSTLAPGPYYYTISGSDIRTSGTLLKAGR